MDTPLGPVPRISSNLSWVDRWGSIKARWAVGRMDFKVDPGLYALGRPIAETPVFVSANYKMSFDRLRETLSGRNAWILVLDTKGINVWCAAGKGTFGTEELVLRVESSGLARVVSHRQLILPQLGGPGIAAHEVQKRSGFKVIYGPIRADDLPVFLDEGLRATPEMRYKTFTLRERTVLIPVELVTAMKWTLLLSAVLFFLGGLMDVHAFWANAVDHGLSHVLALFGALTAGAVFTPILLPWLPGRAFALKGAFTGLVMAGIFSFFRAKDLATAAGCMEVVAWFLLVAGLSAFFAMNFTGASTYTSLSGVKREMKWAVPLEIGAVGLGVVLIFGAAFVS